MLLHTVNKSPFDRNSLDACLRMAKDGSSILLIEDGVYGAMKGTRAESMIKNASGKLKLYVLGPDLEARGMRKENVIDGIEVVDYGGFVDLTVEHQAVQAWL
jgi:tRNA 2-thiouridine synthesizing protein B